MQYQVPDELKLENSVRRVQFAVFDRLDLVIDFQEGKDGIGAIVKSFLDAITKHDNIVISMEAKMLEIVELKRNYRKRNRLFRNLDSAWNVMLTNPVEFNEYIALIPKMKNIETRIERVTDPEAKAQLTSQLDRFKSLEPKCSKQLIIHEAYSIARKERDDAMHELVKHEKLLSKMREEEKILASNICDDHILADESQKSLTSMFPNIHSGYILSAINDQYVENLPFAEVMNRIQRSKSPHRTEFKRYDYRYNPFDHIWNSLQELRDQGVCVENPMLQKMAFISYAARGDYNSVYELLLEGEDPNASDLTGNTALVAAAVNNHPTIVEILIRAGADINMRDKNLMTPLLYAINRGHMEIVRQLLDFNADRQIVDRNLRDAVFYSILSSNIHIIKLFLRPNLVNKTDKLWGYTPLHLAANQGSFEIVDYLLSQRASIYLEDRRHRTAEIIAIESSHQQVAERLKEERINSPGQLIFPYVEYPDISQTIKRRNSFATSLPSLSNNNTSSLVSNNSAATFSKKNQILELPKIIIQTPNITANYQLWIGDIAALDPMWCSDLSFTMIIYLRQEKTLPLTYHWLKKDRKITFESWYLPMLVEDGDNSDNWEGLFALFPEIMAKFNEHIDPTTASTLPSASNSNAPSRTTSRQGGSRQGGSRQNKRKQSNRVTISTEPNTPLTIENNSPSVDSEPQSPEKDNRSTTSSEQKAQDMEEDDPQLLEKLKEQKLYQTNESLFSSPKQKKILFVDDTQGQSLVTALISILLLIKQQQRIKDTLNYIKELRPRAEIERNIQLGLNQLQYQMDQKVLKRMNAKFRQSNVTSLAF